MKLVIAQEKGLEPTRTSSLKITTIYSQVKRQRIAQDSIGAGGAKLKEIRSVRISLV